MDDMFRSRTNACDFNGFANFPLDIQFGFS